MNQKQNSKLKFPNDDLEKSLLAKGFDCVVGIDEVGRGCWAGPVYLGAFVYTNSTTVLEGVNDSKKVTPIKRREIHDLMIAKQEKFHIQIGSIEEINSSGIGNTITKAIEEILRKFKEYNAYYLIDGYFSKDFGSNTSQIIKGDLKHYAISVASIMAKVERDTYMEAISTKYDKWSFEQNEGYGTAKHIEGIKNHGISSIHRTGYKPIAKVLQQQREGANS